MKKVESIIIVLSALLALPFLLVLPWMALFRLLAGLFPSASPLFLLELPAHLFLTFLSHLPRYLWLNLAALLLSATGMALVFARELGRARRCKRLYLPVLGLLAVLAFPLLMRYRPAVEAAPRRSTGMARRRGQAGAGCYRDERVPVRAAGLGRRADGRLPALAWRTLRVRTVHPWRGQVHAHTRLDETRLTW